MNCQVYSFKAQIYNDIHLHTCTCTYIHTHSVQNKSCALKDVQIWNDNKLEIREYFLNEKFTIYSF